MAVPSKINLPVRVSWSLSVMSSMLAFFFGDGAIDNLISYIEGREFDLSLFLVTILPVYFIFLAISLSVFDRSGTNGKYRKSVGPRAESKGKTSEGERSAKRSRDGSIAEEHLPRMVKLMENGLYTDPDLRATDVASELGLTRKQLSVVIQAAGHKDFSNMLNHYRIEEACRCLLERPEMTIKDIYYKVGYNNRQSFLTAFQKMKGSLPSQYKDEKGSSI